MSFEELETMCLAAGIDMDFAQDIVIWLDEKVQSRLPARVVSMCYNDSFLHV